MEKIVVAVDGPAGSGKSTITKKAAVREKLMYIDTGAMYRAVTLKVLEKGLPPEKQVDVERMCLDTEIDLCKTEDGLRVFLDGRDVTRAIRSREVTAQVSLISSYAGVRERLVLLQRSYAREQSVIMEGRDIGTVVFPSADVKIYLDASVEERTRRRYKELCETGKNIPFEKIREDIEIRDRKDSTREVSPLCKAPDAKVIDTTGMTIDQVVSAVCAEIEQAVQ